MSQKNLEAEMDDKKREEAKEDLYVINESIERIKKFVEALKNIKNPEIIEYAQNNKMIKFD
jgi:hypothetical protein